MAVQKFELYDLIVDIIPGAILLIVLYSVLPTGLYAHFFGIQPSLVPGIAIILFSYPVGRILVHGMSSMLENDLLRSYEWMMDRLGAWRPPQTETQDEEPEKEAETDQSQEGSDSDDVPGMESESEHDHPVDRWFTNAETIPPHVASPVVEEVHQELVHLTGTDDDPEALRRYGENLLYDRQTLYGKYEILSTFYRHMTFISLLSFLTYLVYLAVRNVSLPPSLSVKGSAPISGWPIAWIIGLLAISLGAFFLCFWRWDNWANSRNRAFVNDLHAYLREQTGNNQSTPPTTPRNQKGS